MAVRTRPVADTEARDWGHPQIQRAGPIHDHSPRIRQAARPSRLFSPHGSASAPRLGMRLPMLLAGKHGRLRVAAPESKGATGLNLSTATGSSCNLLIALVSWNCASGGRNPRLGKTLFAREERNCDSTVTFASRGSSWQLWAGNGLLWGLARPHQYGRLWIPIPPCSGGYLTQCTAPVSLSNAHSKSWLPQKVPVLPTGGTPEAVKTLLIR